MITERLVSTETQEKPKRNPTGRAVIRRKLRVDQVHAIDLVVLRRSGALDPARVGHVWRAETWLGLAAAPCEAVYAVAVGSGGRWLLLGHTEGPESEEPRIYPVELTATRCHFGGQRWWFRCPLVLRDVPCNRR